MLDKIFIFLTLFQKRQYSYESENSHAAVHTLIYVLMFIFGWKVCVCVSKSLFL